MSAESDFYILSSLIAIGLVMGIFFDIYHVIKSFCRARRRLNIITDFFLWMTITLFVAFGLIFINWGEVRLYVFLAIGLGLLSYYLFLSSSCRKVIVFLVRKVLTLLTFFRKICSTIFNPLLTTIKKLLLFIKKIIYIPVKKLKDFKSKINKNLKKFIDKSRIF